MGPEPIRKRLTQGGLGVCVGACPHDRDKHLGLLCYPSFGVGQRYCLPAVIDEQLFAGYVALAHAAIHTTGELPVKFAELAVMWLST